MGLVPMEAVINTLTSIENYCCSDPRQCSGGCGNVKVLLLVHSVFPRYVPL
jgi:hypothetical protein